MNIQKSHAMKIILSILLLMMMGSFAFLILGQNLMPVENVTGESSCSLFEAEWEQIMPDDCRVPVKVPGKGDVAKGEWMIIEASLPQEFEDTWLCIRAMQQDLKVYVGDTLRKEYSTLETQLFGKTSTMTYIFVELYEDDAGKPIRVELMSDSNYFNYINELLIGDKADIWSYLFVQYLPSLFVALFVFVLSLLVVLCCFVLYLMKKKETEFFYLSAALLLASLWLIVESRLRQFVFPNSTIAMQMGFLLIMILPYPFLAYINAVQKNRYQKVYFVIAVSTVVNFVVCVTLQVLNIKDFFETMTLSHIVLVVLILTMGITIVRDVIKGHVKVYREVAIGFVGVMIGGICEICLANVVEAKLNGITLCIGLMVLLFTAGLKAMREMFETEQEKQIAIAASESKAKFLANMSHEIRTPINTIIGMNEMILRENRDETIEDYAYSIKTASQMLLALINDVLDFSKIEAGKLEISENEYYLSSMLNDVVLGIENRAKQKRLELKLDIDETMPAVLMGDEIRIKQILNNLLSNAVKYTESGSITLMAKGIREAEGFSILLSVTDTGMGIKKEDMERLFSSFQRLDLKKNRYIEGTGLGLNITKQLAENMNGSISVHSEYGKGSCFTVQIPQQIIKDVPMGKLGQRAKEEEAEKKEPLAIPGAKLLIVDDNRMNLKVMKALLKNAQMDLDFAQSGTECLSLTRDKKYDLILMDHMMPEPDGIETLHMLRDEADNPNRDTEVIVLTANAIAGSREEYMKEGFADYLSKPVRIERLEEMLQEYLIDRR